MERAWRIGLLITGGWLWGCAGDVQAERASSEASSATSAAAGTGGAGSGGTSGGALSGHYMRWNLDECTNEEDWLSFGPYGGFIYTSVNRGCGQHGVTKALGKLELDGAILDLAWTTPESSTQRRFTFARLDPYPHAPGGPQIPGYLPGTAGINRMAYAPTGDPSKWHHEKHTVQISKNGNPYDLYEQHITIDLAFDAPLGVPSEKTKCSMTATFSVTTTLGGSMTSGGDTFAFPCSYGPDPQLPWIRLTADGFEQSQSDGSWSDYFQQQGIWEKHPAEVSHAIHNAFRPVLFYAPSGEARLFHDMPWAWHLEMKSPPPDQVN